jgi:hypothetical protein
VSTDDRSTDAAHPRIRRFLPDDDLTRDSERAAHRLHTKMNDRECQLRLDRVD